ncbi:hypothetical protein GCM10009733_061560 [Nonomuraea maheshkhaliensis]|uniref:WD40 repeat domain-containing protein n=1 Tax=Nonomuraea maheshkhaliensis TaxID=419590 RepID=A0ABP4RN26_9ACTN
MRSPKRGAGSSATRRLLALSGALAVAAGLLTALAPAASAADSTTDLGVLMPSVASRSGDVAAGGGKVFVSANTRILVTDTQGTLTGSITGLSGAAGLALNPDGTRLYAALGGSHQVAEVDTADLSIVRHIDLTAYPCPVNLSLSGSRLWVGHGCYRETGGGVIGLDLSAPTPVPVPIDAGTFDAPRVAAAGDTLAVANTSTESSDLLIYDISGTPATPRGTIASLPNDQGLPNDLALTPDGSTVISVDAGTHQLGAWDTTSLAKVRDYATEAADSPAAVAISPDGAHVVGGWKGAFTLYGTSTATTLHHTTPPASNSLGSLAFSGADVFGVLRGNSDKRLRLWRLHGVTLPPSKLTLTGPSTATAYEEFTLTGRLTLSDGSAPGAQTITVTRRSPLSGSPVTPLPDVTTAADGTFTIPDTLPPTKVTYDVFWNGNADHRWSKTYRTISVALPRSSLTLSGPSEGSAGERLQFSGVLKAGDRVFPPTTTLKVHRALARADLTQLFELTPAPDGSFSFTDTPTGPGEYTYAVQWEGDDSHRGAWVYHDVTVLDQR